MSPKFTLPPTNMPFLRRHCTKTKLSPPLTTAFRHFTQQKHNLCAQILHLNSKVSSHCRRRFYSSQFGKSSITHKVITQSNGMSANNLTLCNYLFLLLNIAMATYNMYTMQGSQRTTVKPNPRFIAKNAIYYSTMPRECVDSLPSPDISRKEDQEFISFFDQHEGQVVVVVGADGAGKTVLVNKALKDRKAVVRVDCFSYEPEAKIVARIGKAGSREAVKDALSACNKMGRKPILLFEFVMTDGKQRSSFSSLLSDAVDWQHKYGFCRVVFVLSHAALTSTVCEDRDEWTTFWVNDFSMEEATQYLQQYNIPENDIPKYLDRVGTRPLHLRALVTVPDKEKYMREMESRARYLIQAYMNDPTNGKEQIELMHRMLKQKEVKANKAQWLLFPGKGMFEQEDAFFKYINAENMYLLKKDKIVFESRFIERMMQEMEKAGEL